jgi:hypothetical protein
MPFPLSSILDRLNNLNIARAAAEIPRNRDADIMFSRVWIVVQQIPCTQEHTRSAEAAMDGIVIQEGFLERGEFLAGGKSFHCGNSAAFDLRCQDEAGIDGNPVEKHGTGPAFADFAPALRAGKSERFPQQIEKGQVSMDFCSNTPSVDCRVQRHPDGSL